MSNTDTRVRMILEDYDDAPDGLGTFENMNAIFASVAEAVVYHQRYRQWCWGHIERLDGTFVQKIEDIYTQMGAGSDY